VDSIEEYAFVADHRLRLLQVNRALRRRIEDAGLPAPGEGQPLFRALPCLPPASRGEYLRVLRTGIPVVSEETLRFDGEQRTVRVSKTPVRAGGQVSQVVAVLRDLTEQRRLERMIVEISTAAMCRR
jgi:PAS domain-containing protein